MNPIDGRTQGRSPAEQPPDGRPRGRRGGAVGDPRGRMVAAMLELVGERGYAATTVADVIVWAGASRKTFHEHFEDRQACLSTVGEQVGGEWVARARLALDRAAEDGTGAGEAFVDALFRAALDSPAGLRVIAVELTAAGRSGAECRERVLGELGRLLGRALAGGEDGDGAGGEDSGDREDRDTPERVLLERVLAGAIVRVAYARALRGEPLGLVADVARWALAYRPLWEQTAVGVSLDGTPPPAGGRAPGTLSLAWRAQQRRALPPGESGMSHGFAAHSQRERLLDALANLSAAKGYASLTIPEIASEAAVSVQAFYEHFAGREDVLLVAYEVGHRGALAVVQRACEAQREWPAAVRAGIGALLAFLVSEPSFAHLALIDMPTAGAKPAALAREGTRAYAALLEPGLQLSPDGGPPPEIAIEATASALQELCCTYAATKRTRELPSLTELATHIALTPFLGYG